ncbi:MAG: HAD hydrolase-like protein [Gammaproteobacteria bacterium]|nr:HAD hydrolase-like protein [Gammaproteobacteria bacterium]
MASYPAAICFDLDGTLVDSAPDLALAVDLTFKEMQRKPCPESKVRQWIGNGVDKLLHRALTNSINGMADDDLFQKTRAIFFKAYTDNIGHSSKLYQGVEKTLIQLSGEHIQLACVTNKDRAFTIPLLENLGGQSFF